MLEVKRRKEMGVSQSDWLDALYHFSFDQYYNDQQMNYGVLRVLNDDLISADTGFPMHPHRDMEIITYVVEGELTHGDSMGNDRTVKRGQIQYMSAGTGVYHTEANKSDKTIRSMQIWIYPESKNLEPNYGDHAFQFEDRINQWLHMVSPKDGGAKIEINQDANLYSLYLEEGKTINFDVEEDRQAYLVQIEGHSIINSIELNEQDALMIREENLEITSDVNGHYLLIEMAKSI